MGGDHAMQRVATDATGEITIAASSATEQQAVALRSDVAYVPLDDGSHVAPSASGFVVTRDVAILDPIGAPARRQRLDQPAAVIALKIGDVVEDFVEIVNPTERHHVDILPAGCVS